MSSPADIETIATGEHVHFVRRGTWEYVHRPNISGIVAIVPVTDDGHLVLVRQWRPPIAAFVLELPAGLAGDVAEHAGESLEDAARRELHEETGYEATTFVRSLVGAPSAGICDEMIEFYLATGLRRTGNGGGDDSERITVHEVPLDEVETWIAGRVEQGDVLDLKLYVGLAIARGMG